MLKLWVIRGVHKPNLQVVITHASHVCSQHLFGLWPRMNGMHITQFDHTSFGPSNNCHLIMHVFGHLSRETYIKRSIGEEAF